MIERTSNGLTEVLFNELDNLAAGKSTPQQARATSAIASTIVSVARLQLDFARFVADSRSDGSALPNLPMTQSAGDDTGELESA